MAIEPDVIKERQLYCDYFPPPPSIPPMSISISVLVVIVLVALAALNAIYLRRTVDI